MSTLQENLRHLQVGVLHQEMTGCIQDSTKTRRPTKPRELLKNDQREPRDMFLLRWCARRVIGLTTNTARTQTQAIHAILYWYYHEPPLVEISVIELTDWLVEGPRLCLS